MIRSVRSNSSAGKRSASRDGVISPLTILLLLGILVMGYVAIVPTYWAVRDSVRVDLAARALDRCATAVRMGREEASVAEPATLEEIEEIIAEAKKEPLVWPSGIVPGSLDLSNPTNPTVRVVLRHGPALITLQSNNIERLY